MSKEKNPWAWVPSLYFAQGMPYVIVMTVAVVMYKRLEISNAEIALYTSWLYLPWVIKPLWSPVVDLFKTKRWWILLMQLVIGAGLAGVALTLPTSSFFRYSLAFFWLLAFSSATHDIASDGFYMLGLNKDKQAYFIGIRSTFYRIAMISGQGLLVILAGYFEEKFELAITAWSFTFIVLAVIFVIFLVYHHFILPKPTSDTNSNSFTLKEFWQTFASYFQKENIVASLIFILIFRLGEAQLVKMATPFLMDSRDVGGLGLSTKEVGLVYGTIGILALTVGGILGGIVASRKGLKYWILPMALAMNLPNLAYVYLSYALPENFWTISFAVGFEQFGYGFGFTAFMLYLIQFSNGKNKTAHYAISTGFMALGMMLPGMISGWLQEIMGYDKFFIWVMLCTIPGFVVIRYLRIKD